MAGRIIAQMVAMGLQVGVRVFAQVYQEVARGAAKGGGSAGAKQAVNEGAKAVRKKLSAQMPLEEAYKVLDLPPAASAEEIMTKYDHLFEATDRNNGGNLYLQSKVYRAKESIEAFEPEKLGGAAGTPPADAAKSAGPDEKSGGGKDDDGKKK
eukprot:CAMPEP_0206300506 /NCGR_PEP_ID=MMETSP0106_2-20121207/7736_1 /ASSEMBLY_ACC=CAM_ASM_000206 /TAXON_ID=81532 /ORGANISM="Acanthoeca-like sp., Strain 10tr" /LENGTH=152 /DNA_ID=CAMNT_0053731231 /DNA_START=141 /DNA_END=596 /DNA_ORIENTATION=-